MPFNTLYLTNKNDRLLSFGSYYGKLKFDFEKFKTLQELNFEHVKGTVNYGKLNELKHLRVHKYDQKNLDKFSPLHTLESLVGGRKTNAQQYYKHTIISTNYHHPLNKKAPHLGCFSWYLETSWLRLKWRQLKIKLIGSASQYLNALYGVVLPTLVIVVSQIVPF